MIFHISERMVGYIVLGFPHVHVGTEEVDTDTCQLIEPAFSAEAAMGTIVHDIEANGCGQPTKDDGFQNGKWPKGSEENQVDIYPNKCQNHQNSFEV